MTHLALLHQYTAITLLQSVRSDILLRVWWRDPRLAYDNTSILNFSDDPTDLIWVPDVYVFNAIETNRHRALKPNLRTKIGPNGNVYISIRYHIFIFDMFLTVILLHKFPMVLIR